MPDCPVCLAPDVTVEVDTLNNALDQVDCPRCLRFQIDRQCVEELGQARLDHALIPSLDSLSDYLRLRTADDSTSINAQNWLELARQGQRLRRELQPEAP